MNKLFQREENGITLISLVITIIILLILAGVAISMLSGDSGVLEQATDAKNKMNEATLKEKEALDSYNLLMAVDGLPIKIGDYVEYTPNNATYTNNEVNCVNSKGNSFTTETGLKWRVLGIDSSGKVLLVSDKATTQTLRLNQKNNDTSTAGVYVGLEAYEKGPSLIDDICEQLYSSDEYGTARNMKTEDVNKVLGYNENKAVNKITGEYEWFSTDTTLEDLEKKYSIPSENLYKISENDETYKKLKLSRYAYNGEDYKGTVGYDIVFAPLAIPEDKINKVYGNAYWLSSNVIFANVFSNATCMKWNYMIAAVYVYGKKADGSYQGDFSSFGWGSSISAPTMYDTWSSPQGSSGFYELSLRPVVALNKNIEFSKSETDDNPNDNYDVWKIK